MNPKEDKHTQKITSKHITIKLLKNSVKEKILTSSRKTRHVMYRGTKIRMKADFFSEMMQVRRRWYGIFKLQDEKLNTVNTGFYIQQKSPLRCST